jgi:hypothetical protein
MTSPAKKPHPRAAAAIHLAAAGRCRRAAAERDGTYEGDTAWRGYWLRAARRHLAACRADAR